MIKREKRFFFILLLHSLHMIRREKKVSFILLLRSVRYDQEKKILSSISALYSLRHGHKKKKWIFISPLVRLSYDHKKISFFHFTKTVTTQIYSYISLRYWPVAKISKRYPPQKNMSNLKTLFFRNFSGVFQDLLP